MPYRTKDFSMFPWFGGVVTSLDPAVIEPNQLVQGSNVSFGTGKNAARNSREGINFNWDDVSAGSVNLVGGCDFWFGSTTKTNYKMALNDDKTLKYRTTAGAASTATVDSTATSWSSTVSTGSMEVINQYLVIGVDGANNYPRKWAGSGNIFDLGCNVTTGATHTNATVDGLASMSGIQIGMTITGTDIPAGTYVGSINTAGSSITLVNISGAAVNATGTTSPVTFQFRSLNTPKGQVFRRYLGRLWSNDKANPDRLHYSTTGAIDEWGGVGDSGALDIAVGDGDPIGITAIFPTFRGNLYIAKQSKLYVVTGTTPEDFGVQLVSDGIGCVSHNSICAIDETDIVFISEKGIHSLAATIEKGDEQQFYLSYDIQKTFNENWPKSRLKYTWGSYLSRINSVGFAVSDSTDSSTANKTIWFYHIPGKYWYSWNAISCQCMFVGNDSDQKRYYFGGSNSRMAKSFNGANYDTASSGGHTTIPLVVKTGNIYLDKNPMVVNAFKKFTLLYGPSGTHSITVLFKIDNYSTQILTFSQAQTTGLLGTNFTLGSSLLGYGGITGPYTQQIEGYGRSFQVTMSQNIAGAAINIQGFVVEYEPLGPAQETITNG